MKKILLILLIPIGLMAQNKPTTMKEQFIQTKIGNIAVYINAVESENIPVIFLHGVYFDHHLWDNQVAQITDRTVIAIDMPWHGNSKENIANKWNMKDCGNMLLEILDSLEIKKVVAIGHSWGSMTILQASSIYPEKFASIGFCNMPFEATSLGKKIGFQFQHTALIFKIFYIKQASKSLYAKQSLRGNPDLYEKLYQPMSKLTAKQIRKVDKYVILDAENTSTLIEKLKIPVLALKGENDYVPVTPHIETIIIKGGHVSPLEATNEVNEFCKKVILNNKMPIH